MPEQSTEQVKYGLRYGERNWVSDVTFTPPGAAKEGLVQLQFAVTSPTSFIEANHRCNNKLASEEPCGVEPLERGRQVRPGGQDLQAHPQGRGHELDVGGKRMNPEDFPLNQVPIDFTPPTSKVAMGDYMFIDSPREYVGTFKWVGAHLPKDDVKGLWEDEEKNSLRLHTDFVPIRFQKGQNKLVIRRVSTPEYEVERDRIAAASASSVSGADDPNNNPGS